MTKTPEQMAEEYADLCVSDPYYAPLKAGFLAGYQAAKDQVADTDKVIAEDSCDHILDMEKMVDVNSSNNSNGWISVNERLPEEDTGVLAFINYTVENEPIRRVTWGAFRGGLWLTDNEILAHPLVSHWMPLPEPPKGEK